MTINFVSHGGKHRISVVFCPEFSQRFLHFSHDVDGGWVFRDYICGRQLKGNATTAVENKVLLSLPEKLVKNLDTVLEPNIDEKTHWKNHLTDLTEEFINNPDLESQIDGWEPF